MNIHHSRGREAGNARNDEDDDDNRQENDERGRQPDSYPRTTPEKRTARLSGGLLLLALWGLTAQGGAGGGA